jgi:hypothetical protein
MQLELAELLRTAIERLETLGIPHMVVGSVASMAYGEPRSTLDIDIVIQLRPADVKALCQLFPEPDFYVSEAAAREAIRFERMFNVIANLTGLKIDFAISSNSPWGKSQLQRRRRMEIFPGVFGFTATPEDVIVAKMMYYQQGESEKHLRDIASMWKISGDSFDLAYLEEWISRLQLTSVWAAVKSRLI